MHLLASTERRVWCAGVRAELTTLHCSRAFEPQAGLLAAVTSSLAVGVSELAAHLVLEVEQESLVSGG